MWPSPRHVFGEQRARAADVDDPDAAVGLVAEQLLHPLGHLADRLDRGADEEVLLGAEPSEGEAEEQRPPLWSVRLVRAAAVEGLADVEDRRARLHLRGHDLVLLGLAARRPEVAARDDPGRAVLGGEVAQRVEHDDLELRHVRRRHGVPIGRDRRVDPGRVVTVEVLHGLVGQDLDQLRRAEEVVEARRQEVVVGDRRGDARCCRSSTKAFDLPGSPSIRCVFAPMKSISIGMWFGVPGSEAASSPSNSALSLDSSSGLDGVLDDRAAVPIDGLDQRPDRDVGTEAFDVWLGHVGSVRRVARGGRHG